MSGIDVAVPCFQYGRYLRDSVGSVLRQDVGSLRVVIIDNGSTDDSLDIARELAKEDKRVDVISHSRNFGQAASLNEAIDWARAEYFMTLDADDLLAPGCLKRAISVMDKDNSIAFSHGAQALISGEESFPHNESPPENEGDWRVSDGETFIGKLCSKGHNLVANPGVMRRTKAQKEVGYYDSALKYANDMNMWMRLATRGSVAETSVVQGVRRVHPAQLTQLYRDFPVMDLVEHLNNFHHFFCHEGKGLPNSQSHYSRVQRRIAFNGLHMAGVLLLNGRMKQSLECIRFSTRAYAGMFAALKPATLVPTNSE